MKDMLNLSLRLALICAVAALLLTQVNGITREPILLAENAAEVAAIEAVLPAFDNKPVEDTAVTREGTAEEATYHIGIKDGRYAGAAFKAVTYDGYSGEIVSMIGVGAEGNLTGMRILRHAETPGLGAKYADAALLNEFYVGRPLVGTDWRVKKDGGPIDAISGATVTGRAVCGALAAAMNRFREDLPAILEASAGYGGAAPGGDGTEDAATATAEERVGDE
ncbi:MAG: RnfABCDGE type electron transport complex subunit G [Candidatus Eisenbacteria bacterium]|nr:RnfABCDGE type electron transport complex subunit G [Candidatus Eisenbacteria bacterium]